MKNCLTIAGSDCSGGAGIQADLKTFSALGCYGMSVITSVFAENTHALLSSMSVSQEVIADQLEAVFSDIRVDAVKIGVLPDTGAMRAVAAALFKYKPEIVVCDPVIAATAGGELMNSSALGAFINGIIPLCSLLTPNIPEAETLLSCHIENVTDMKAREQCSSRADTSPATLRTCCSTERSSAFSRMSGSTGSRPTEPAVRCRRR